MADVIGANDYYSFGMAMPGRGYAVASSGNYRYGFNGKENDNEVKGVGDQIDYGFRVYDPRVGRFLSVDPIAKKYPELTPYQYASNTPIQAIDVDGLEKLTATGGYPSNDPNQLPSSLQAANLVNQYDPQKTYSSPKPAQKKASTIDASRIIVFARSKCHIDGEVINDRLNAERAKAYAQLDYAHDQVELPRSSFWTAWSGSRILGEKNYVNGKLYDPRTVVNGKGYITDKLEHERTFSFSDSGFSVF